MKYLYGASVQGIQGFIFETGKLVEIAGASELVEKICTDFFQENVKGFQKESLIIGAAGNIKYLFPDKESCSDLVAGFPRKISRLVPGVQLSQAVVEVNGELNVDHLDQLEDRLRTQRNRAWPDEALGWMVAERSRKTGQPATGRDQKEEGEFIDKAQRLKREAGRNSAILERKLDPDEKLIFPRDLKRLTRGKENSWIAVIHADGNDLGKRIMKMSESLSGDRVAESFRELSLRLEKATNRSAREAIRKVFRNRTGELPFRPIVLGGDDITVIIGAEHALAFTEAFLAAFEEHTRNEFADFQDLFKTDAFSEGLTACGGIAYVKENYPFYYAVNLAESLCKYSKKIAKDFDKELVTPSCLAFHKVHSSFIGEFNDIADRELKAAYTNISFLNGPYFLEECRGFGTIKQLRARLRLINEDGAPKARLRNWLSEIQLSEDRADQLLSRIRNITRKKKYITDLGLADGEAIVTRKIGEDSFRVTHIYDLIALSNLS